MMEYPETTRELQNWWDRTKAREAAGTATLRGNGNGTSAGKSAQSRRPAAEGGVQPMRISGAGATKAPARLGEQPVPKEPSPANRPVVLRIVASNTLIPTKRVEMNLVLIKGGLA